MIYIVTCLTETIKVLATYSLAAAAAANAIGVVISAHLPPNAPPNIRIVTKIFVTYTCG